ncbi:MAG TPA: F0F1 ATP synthase subunit B [Lacipirellulaceae bacterium]|nr:F0F1 ATP synthase subunit B [Lacipirellulaceae bacterium]
MRFSVWCLAIVAVAALAARGPALAQQSAPASEAEAGDPAPASGGEHAPDGAHAGDGAHEDIGHGNATRGMLDVSSLASDLSVYTFVVFLLLLGILSKAAWPRISAALEEREKRIEGAIAEATAKNEQAQRLLAEHEAKLAGAAAEVRALLEEARRDAEAAKAEIVAEARAAAQQEHDRARRDIDVALDGATKHLAETSANLAVELAGKAIRETINPAKQQELVREALAKLSAAAPSRN